ncbi:MAG: permease [Acidimicrobiales bacterium]|nr:permease [Acidimicrobiales bacterium]
MLDTPGVGSPADADPSGGRDASDPPTDEATTARGAEQQAERRANRIGLAGLVWAYLPVVLIARGSFGYLFEGQALRNWSTIVVSLTLQALPFLVLGTVVSAAISALVPASWIARAVPRRTALAVPVAGAAGALLPGCECSSVPVAGRLVDRGIPQGAALTFLLAAPAVNPIVLASTAVAFPGRPEMVLARFVASLVTAMIVGFAWSRFARPDWLTSRMAAHDHGGRLDNFVSTAASDFLQAGGFLVAGAGLVAAMQTLVPPSVFDRIGGSGPTAVLVMALLAIVLSVCSEADAFVAAGMTQFSLTSRLVFLVVGPMVDLKLVALQAGAFGRSFSVRFTPLVLVTAITVATLVGSLLL